MAAENWRQKFLTNPITSNQNGDLLYWARSPYGVTNDAVILWEDFSAQFALASGGGLRWAEVTAASQAAAVNNGYVANRGTVVTVTLPATAAEFSVIAVVGKGAGGWSLVANTGQTIKFGNQTSSTAGSLSSTNASDVVYVICTTANTVWTVTNVIGNLTVA